MRHQGSFGHRPDARVYIVIGQGQPVVQATEWIDLHHSRYFRLPLQAVGLQVGDGLQRVVHHMAVGGQDVLNVVLGAGLINRSSDFM